MRRGEDYVFSIRDNGCGLDAALVDNGRHGGIGMTIMRERAERIGSRLEIRSDVDSALVVLDGAFVGRTPYMADSLAPGVHRIRVLHPDITGWLAAKMDSTVASSYPAL